MIGQIQGEYEAKDERMARYFSNVRANFDKLSKWVVKRIPRAKNMHVDALAGIVSTLPIKEVVLLLVYLQVISSIAVALICSTSQTSINWMNEIEAYIQTGKLSENSKQARSQNSGAGCPLHSDRGQPL